MAESIFARVSRLLSATVEDTVDRMEQAGGDAVMREAIREADRAIDQVKAHKVANLTKYVAPWMGFEWRNPESGSEWSLARFHRARQSADPLEREQLLAEVAEYNADDLWAMRAVWLWLREHGASAAAAVPQRTPPVA